MRPALERRLWLGLSALGLLVAAYLTVLHYDSRVPLVCSNSGLVDCARVLASPYATVWGIPVAAFGLLWFAVAFLLGIRAKGGAQNGARVARLAWALAGAAVVIYLIYVEVGELGHICMWCSVVHATVLALVVVATWASPSVEP